jgi:predicted amidohydrolase YtcJ
MATAVAIRNGRFAYVGDDNEVAAYRGSHTKSIDLNGRTVVPGLRDTHLHLIRGGLNFNMELRWDGVPSLADALRMLKDQARRTPPPQWVRVVGGWNEFQFAERRLPTLDEINEAAPDTPVFLLHLYDRALLNRAALRAVGYSKDTPEPPGGVIQRDKQGNLTGLLVAKPNAMILYKTLALGPKLDPADQENSTRHFMRELNRLGVTSAIDAGGGFQNYPDDYEIIEALDRKGEMTIRVAYNLFTQKPGGEFEDFRRWIGMTSPGKGSEFLRMNGAGEMLTFSAADFEDFLEPRPDLSPNLEGELQSVVRLLVENRWPFRLHATYDESIARFLDVFESIDRDVPFAGLHWFFDHAETVSTRNLERIKALGGGIAVQHRMAYQGEYFVARYGAERAKKTPPISEMLGMGIPVSAGTDATRVASYNPWVCLYWLVTGRTVGGLSLYADGDLISREQALKLYTQAGGWFANENEASGTIAAGQHADLVALSDDYFEIPADRIRAIESVLTIVGGRVVHAADPFSTYAPPALPVSPDWSPVGKYGGYARPSAHSDHAHQCSSHSRLHRWLHQIDNACKDHQKLLWGDSGCGCWAF